MKKLSSLYWYFIVFACIWTAISTGLFCDRFPKISYENPFIYNSENMTVDELEKKVNETNERKRQEYYEKRRYYIFVIPLYWLSPIGLVYGVVWTIGKRNLLNGWYRLFFVYACTHLLYVIIKAVSILHWRRYPYDTWELKQLVYVFIHAILPIGGVYLFSLVISWVIKGFKK